MRIPQTLLLLLVIGSVSFAGDLKAKVAAATGTQPSVSLTCSAGTGAAPTSFNLYRSTASGGPYSQINSAPTCAFTDTTVAFSTTYFYVTTGVNSAGESGFSNQATATVPQNPVPNPPTNLTVGQIIAKSVPLQWKAPAPQSNFTLVGYGVYRGAHPTLPNPGRIAVVTSLNFTDTCPNKVCYYEVAAIDRQGKTRFLSSFSNIAEASTQ